MLLESSVDCSVLVPFSRPRSWRDVRPSAGGCPDDGSRCCDPGSRAEPPHQSGTLAAAASAAWLAAAATRVRGSLAALTASDRAVQQRGPLTPLRWCSERVAG